MWLHVAAILAFVATSACGRSPMGGATGAAASNRADSGVGPSRGVDDAGIAGQGGGVPDGATPTEGGVGSTGTSAFTQISAGGISTCGLRADGTAT